MQYIIERRGGLAGLKASCTLDGDALIPAIARHSSNFSTAKSLWAPIPAPTVTPISLPARALQEQRRGRFPKA